MFLCATIPVPACAAGVRFPLLLMVLLLLNIVFRIGVRGDIDGLRFGFMVTCWIVVFGCWNDDGPRYVVNDCDCACIFMGVADVVVKRGVRPG